MNSARMLFMSQDMANEENEQQRQHTTSANLRRDVRETFQQGLKASDGEPHLTSDEVERCSQTMIRNGTHGHWRR